MKRVLSDSGRLFVSSWILVAIVLGLAWLVLGCGPRLQETQVRRAESLGDVDAIADATAADGWRVVDVEPIDGGAFVLVLSRDGGVK